MSHPLRIRLFIVLTVILASSARSFSQESLTVTTYYPSDYGLYKEISVFDRQSIGDVNADKKTNWNDMAVDEKNAGIPGSLTVSRIISIGTNKPQLSQDNRAIHLDVAENILAKDIYLGAPREGTPRWASEGNWQQGMHCGIHTSGVTATITIPCQGHNPKDSCPAGFARAGGDFEAQGTRRFYTCVKQ